MTHLLTHATDLPVTALVDGHAQKRWCHHGHPGRCRHAVLEQHAATEMPHLPGGGLAVYMDQVLLGHAERGMSQPMGQLTVVGDDDQAFRVHVQPTYGIDARLRGHERHHGGTIVGVFCRRDHSQGFVDQVMDQAGAHRDWHTVELDQVDLGVHPSAQHWHLAVDGDPSIGDQVLAHAARADTRAGQDLLKPLTGMQCVVALPTGCVMALVPLVGLLVVTHRLLHSSRLHS